MARVKFIKSKVIFRYHTNGVSKVIQVQIPVPNWEKTKKWEKISGIQNGAMRGLQIGAGFRDCKSGQDGLQIGAALGISNRGKEITNWSRDFKSGKRDFKSGQGLQIVVRGISNRGRGYKLFQSSSCLSTSCNV